MTSLAKLYGFSPGQVAAMVAKNYGLNVSWQFNNPAKLRREAIAQRLRLYRDDSKVDFERMIDCVFDTAKVRAQRKKMIDVASELNVTAAIVNEVASLYDQPALRFFKNDPAKTERFRKRSEEIALDEVMQEAHRLTFLCNEVLLWSVSIDGATPRLRIVTPDCFDVIPHPHDALTPVAFLVDAAPAYVAEGVDKTRAKYYELWDDEVVYDLNGNGELIGEPRPHGLGRIPGVLFHRRMPVDRLLDCRAGNDITSAHLGAGLLGIMMMRLAKSQGERQPILSGNLAQAASRQTMDGESPIVLPPDVVAEMLDSKTSPDHYLMSKKDKLTSVALRYGLSYEQLTRTDQGEAQGGKAFTARRRKLTELRLEQRRRARIHERETIELMGFDPTGLRVDHQEQAVPADAGEEIDLLDKKVRMGLDSPIAYLMRKDPDLSREDAIAMIQNNVRDWALTVVWLRALNTPAGADIANAGSTPELNGGQRLDANGNPIDDGANDGSGTPQIADLGDAELA